MRYIVCVVIALAYTTLCAQTPPARLQFEVASVKPAANDETRASQVLQEVMRNRRRPGQIPMMGTDRVRLQNWTLLDLIAAAYSVRATDTSGPAWLSDEAFDIEAKVPDGTAKETLNVMLQSLLEERFGLKVHRDTKSEQGFLLMVGKDGPKLKPVLPPSAPDLGLTDEERRAQSQQKAQAGLDAMAKRREDRPMPGRNYIGWSSITTEELAAQLVRFVDAPVVDATGLTANYSVRIDTSNNPDVPGGTIFDAVEKLGLKLEPHKVTAEAVVVDQVSKTPTAN